MKFADVALEPPLANLQNLMIEVAAYFDEVSYGQTSVAPAYRRALGAPTRLSARHLVRPVFALALTRNSS